MDFKQTHVEHDHKHGSPLMSCRFSPAGEMVFFGAEDYSVWGWNWSTDRKVEFPAQAWVRSLACSADGETLVTGGYDGRLIWWRPADEKPEPVRVVEAHEGWIRSIAVSGDGNRLASVGNDKVVRLWSMAEGSPIAEYVGQTNGQEGDIAHTSFVYNVAFHPHEQALVTGDLMGQLIHWNLETGQPVRSWTAETLSKYDKGFRAQIGGFRKLLFDADGTKLFASGITNVTNAFAGVGNPSIVEFDWNEGKQSIEYITKPALRGVAWGAAVLSDDTIVGAQGGSNGHLMFWTPGTAESVHQFKLKQNARDLDLHRDGLRLGVACSDGHLRICLMDQKAEET